MTRAVLEPDERRAERRIAKRRSLTLRLQTTGSRVGSIEVKILDISQGGLLIQAEAPALAVDDRMTIVLPNHGPIGTRVAWVSGPFLGCEFDHTVAPATISAALLRSDPKVVPSSALQDERASGWTVQPQLNFSVPFLITLCLWVSIGLAAYLLI